MGDERPGRGTSAPDPWALRAVRAAPFLEKEMLAVRALVPRGGACIDIGASYGTYSVLLARLVGAAGTVDAVEPRPRSRAVLRAAARVAGGGRIRVHALALGERPGTGVLATPRRRFGLPVPGRSHLLVGRVDDGHEYGGGATRRIVRIEALDRFVDRVGLERLDLVKIDVEGAELAVLRGGEATLGRFRPVIVCEVEERHTAGYGHRADEVLGWLADRGWQPNRFGADGLRPVQRIEPDERNYVFVPPGDRAAGRNADR